MKKYVLAIHEDSNANATLFYEGKVLFSISEASLSRVRFQAGMPIRSIKFIFNKFRIGWKDVDLVAGNKYHFIARVFGASFPTFEHSFFGFSQRINLYFHYGLTKSRLLQNITLGFNKGMLKLRTGLDAFLVDHHEAHAYSAYYTANFDNTLICTMDNYGDGISAAVFVGEQDQIKLCYCSSALGSPGQFYGEIAQLLGFHPLLAGKMTGLAAYGNPEPAYEHMRRLFFVSKDKRDICLPEKLFQRKSSKIFQDLILMKKEDVAAAAQKRLEDVICEYVQHAMKLFKKENLCLAGGVFANVRVNQRLHELPEVKNIFIHPAMSDLGISYGAGLKYYKDHGISLRKPLETIYLGMENSEQEIENALKMAGVKYTKKENIEKEIAKLLAAGEVVCRFNSRLEYGPRALGNRSILFNTKDKTVKDWLNKRLHRTEFMPFAPTTLGEYAQKCYDNIEGAGFSAKFMNISFMATDWMKRVSPGVIHVDGSVRPQLVYSKDNESYYKIVKEYYDLTGIPSIINTSFNMHEEPIVTSIEDALTAMGRSQLPYLAAGDYLAEMKK